MRPFALIVALMLAATGTLAVRSALDETQTWDEGIHISAGYEYLTRGDYSWNVEHPPLVKLMSAIPLRFLGLESHPYDAAGKRVSQVQHGIDFLYTNRRHADTILFAARGATIVLTLLFLAAFAWWMRRRFGPAAALLATVLCAFDPNLIAHGRYVTTDVPLTAFFFFACVLWVEYLEHGGARRLLLAALVIAIAMVVKFSAVLLGPPLVLLYAIAWIRRPADFPVRRAVAAAAAVAAITLAVVAVIYWPETVRCWRSRAIAPITQHAWLMGLNDVISHNEGGHESYLMGIRSNQGLWYYFPVVFAVKSTMAALAATVLLLIAGLWTLYRRRPIPLIAYGLAVPPILFFAFSMTSSINLGLRHILPIYPFLYAGVGAVAGASLRSPAPSRVGEYGPRPPASAVARLLAAAAALALLQIVETATIAPDYLAFFNALAGGPGHGPEYLVDSNIDWGQDVKKLVHWLDAHGTRRVRVAYFGNAQMHYYGVGEVGFPAPLDQAGWDAVDDYCVASVTPLNGVYVPLDMLTPLRLRQPIAKIGWSMYMYDLRKKK